LAETEARLLVANNKHVNQKTKWWRLNAEIIGLSAVVLSLILVAMELRQNTIALEGQAVLDLNAMVVAQADTVIQQPEIREIEQQFRTNPNREDYTADQLTVFTHYVLKIAGIYETTWVFHQKGLVDDEQFETYQFAFCESLNGKAHKQVLDSNRRFFRASYLEDFFAYCRSRPEGMNW
jgi:hypothetical protein